MELAGEVAAARVAQDTPKRVRCLPALVITAATGGVAADIFSHQRSPLMSSRRSSPMRSTAPSRAMSPVVPPGVMSVYRGPSRDELVSLSTRRMSSSMRSWARGSPVPSALRSPFGFPRSTNEVAGRVRRCSLRARRGDRRRRADCVEASVTVTILAPKIGLYSGEGPEYAGEIACGELYEPLGDVIGDVDLQPRSWSRRI